MNYLETMFSFEGKTVAITGGGGNIAGAMSGVVDANSGEAVLATSALSWLGRPSGNWNDQSLEDAFAKLPGVPRHG